MTPDQAAVMASVALGWMEESVPERLFPALEAQVKGWRENGAAPLALLWRPILDALRQCGCFDSELEGCRMALSLEPLQPSFRLRLGQILLRLGRVEEARAALLAVMGLPAIRAEALLTLAEAEPLAEAPLAELEALVLADANWGERHEGLVSHLVDLGAAERARAFLAAWTERWSLPPSKLMSLGVMAMKTGQPEKARQLFEPLWKGASDDQTAMLGAFHGEVAPYDAAAEARILAALEEAFALPEDQLARFDLAPPDPAHAGKRVLMASFGDRALVNDLAAHYGESARLAGLDFHLFADSALTLPREFRGSDSEAQRRVKDFEAEAERLKPDVILVDVASPLLLRGLNPAVVWDLKRRIGCRVIGLFRDSHRHVSALVEAWASACDAVVIDILSPSWQTPLAAKAVPLIVPAAHGAFLEASPPPDLGMLFMGSVNFLPRQAILSVLLTEEIGFTAITGPDRHRLAPDMASYARLLKRAKAVLNISAHSPQDHLVTGRVWESLAAGALLVEQDNAGTRRFLTPWRHFLPWRDLADIVHLARFVEVHPDWAGRVADEGQAWAARRYSPKAIWGAMLARALAPRPEAEIEAEGMAAHRWSSLTLG